MVEQDPGDWASHALGRSNSKTCEILLNKHLNNDLKAQVLLHEVIHLIADMNDLKALEESEALVSALANNLFDFLRRNPKATRFIADLYESVKPDAINVKSDDLVEKQVYFSHTPRCY